MYLETSGTSKFGDKARLESPKHQGKLSPLSHTVAISNGY